MPTVIQGRLLARNTTANFFGQLSVGIIGILALPTIITNLGPDRFGILSLIWVALGSFTLLDLGLGRATTKYVAEFMGKGELGRLPSLVWTSLLLQMSLGALGGILLAATVPSLVGWIFTIPSTLVEEARASFLLVSAALPFVLGTATLRGVLEAAQRFDYVNLVKAPMNAATYLIPLAGLALDFGLPAIVLLLIVTRLAAEVAYLALSVKVFPQLMQRIHFERELLHLLLVYGGWVTISNLVVPLLVYLDRVLIGSLLSLDAVAYYVAPYEMLSGFGIIPASLTLTLFPAFSTLGAKGLRESCEDLYARSIKYILLTLGPLVILVVIFAHKILGLWLGGVYPQKSGLTLQILAVGLLVAALGWVPGCLLQGLGRPELTAKCHLLQLPLYVSFLWYLVPRMGIAGAATAFALRVVLEASFLFAVCQGLGFVSTRALSRNGLWRSILSLFGLTALLGVTSLMGISVLSEVAIAAIAIFLFTVAVWRYMLDRADKGFLASLIGQDDTPFKIAI